MGVSSGQSGPGTSVIASAEHSFLPQEGVEGVTARNTEPLPEPAAFPGEACCPLQVVFQVVGVLDSPVLSLGQGGEEGGNEGKGCCHRGVWRMLGA